MSSTICWPLRPGVLQQRDLLGQKGLGLRRRRELATREHEGEGIYARNVERRHSPGPAQRLHQGRTRQVAVLDRHPTGAVHHVGARVTEYVRNALAVALDPQAGPRLHDAHRRLASQTEDVRLEVVRQVRVRHLVEQRCQAVVEKSLVERVRVRRRAAGLPGRQHVPGFPGRGEVRRALGICHRCQPTEHSCDRQHAAGNGPPGQATHFLRSSMLTTDRFLVDRAKHPSRRATCVRQRDRLASLIPANTYKKHRRS